VSDALVPRAGGASTALAPARSRISSPGPITPRPQARHGLDRATSTLFVGTEAIPSTHVRAYTASGRREKDLGSAFATIAICSFVAAVMLFGVLELDWRSNLLLEGALFGGIALCAVGELFSAPPQSLYTFDIETMDGRKVRFVTADEVEAAAVKAALDRGLAN
jgi:hypothetical protein